MEKQRCDTNILLDYRRDWSPRSGGKTRMFRRLSERNGFLRGPTLGSEKTNGSTKDCCCGGVFSREPPVKPERLTAISTVQGSQGQCALERVFEDAASEIITISPPQKKDNTVHYLLVPEHAFEQYCKIMLLHFGLGNSRKAPPQQRLPHLYPFAWRKNPSPL